MDRWVRLAHAAARRGEQLLRRLVCKHLLARLDALRPPLPLRIGLDRREVQLRVPPAARAEARERPASQQLEELSLVAAVELARAFLLWVEHG